ncbi:hypothetical protein GJ496_007283 [Pomphorhynchus laevis]|nr:hypothetical protein GJ496_007283 [Pomphorhynchus laevis]
MANVHENGKQGCAIINESLTFEKAEESANYIKSIRNNSPKIAIICGSGCGVIADLIQNQTVISFSDIPNFPIPTGVPGHKGALILGNIHEKEVVCMQGRYHAYEGYSTASCTFPVRVLKQLGVEIFFNTAACGALNPNYHEGDIMLLIDHISLPALNMDSPLIGKNDKRFGERFLPMVCTYDRQLQDIVCKVFEDIKATDKFRKGVYINIGGPAFETVAEVIMLRNFGADAVGMSMTHENTVAKHCGMRIVGIGIIADMAPDNYQLTTHTSEQAVIECVKKSGELLKHVVDNFVKIVEI